MVILTGPAGAGKSTILRSLLGSPTPQAAVATIDGKCLKDLSHRRRRRKAQQLRMACLPKTPALVSNLTVMENLVLPVRYLGEMGERQALREAFVLLNAVGLGWSAGRLPGSLSIEDQRTVAIVRGFLRRPRAALLDEPLSGLDAASLAGVRPILKGTLSRGECAILATTRDLGPYQGVPFRSVEIAPGWIRAEESYDS
jgi:ABC-type multidrug transport system ATPase subunit